MNREASFHDCSSKAGVKCEGSSTLVLTQITPEIIRKFIAAISMYCASKENTCKNVASWLILSLVSFSETVFKNNAKTITNATLHIKDPRDSMTYGWLYRDENLLTIQIYPANL